MFSEMTANNLEIIMFKQRIKVTCLLVIKIRIYQKMLILFC